jgi:hypothetical protein
VLAFIYYDVTNLDTLRASRAFASVVYVVAQPT